VGPAVEDSLVALVVASVVGPTVGAFAIILVAGEEVLVAVESASVLVSTALIVTV
jgi:hypothetical protein